MRSVKRFGYRFNWYAVKSARISALALIPEEYDGAKFLSAYYGDDVKIVPSNELRWDLNFVKEGLLADLDYYQRSGEFFEKCAYISEEEYYPNQDYTYSSHRQPYIPACMY